jgi:hypothetical protein
MTSNVANSGRVPITARFRFNIRTLLILAASVGLFSAPIALLERHYFAPYRQFERINQKIKSLALRRPPNMKQSQWDAAIDWTHTLYYFNSPNTFQFDSKVMSQFEKELNQKLASQVDMGTILWLWDEFSKLQPEKTGYQLNRSKMLEDIAGA